MAEQPHLDNRAIAERLDSFSTLLELAGANPYSARAYRRAAELIRSTDEEKQSQLRRLRAFQQKNSAESAKMLERLRQAVMRDENVFAVLMDAVRVCSLGQITHALFEVGGQYRRSM